VYYTTIFEVDEDAYTEIMKREMGKENARKWEQGEPIGPNNYRPRSLESEFGKTEVFIIPEEGRKSTQTHLEARYVKEVRGGIEESYKNKPLQLETNLDALKKAVEESKSRA
jgi:hypothetical protein